MSWFFIALGAPFLWAITNHIDKVLLQKYFKGGGVNTLLIFSAGAGVLTLPFLYLAHPAVLSVEPLHIMILLLASILMACSLWLYFLALNEEEASIVVVFYQLVPVFGAILGYVLLGEVLTPGQLLAMGIIILGALIISIEVDVENRFRLKHRTVYLMSLASLLIACESVLFKFVAVQENLWSSLFWQYVGLALFAVGLYAVFGSCRTELSRILRGNVAGILGVNILNELIYILGNFLFAYSYLLAPVALVLLVNAYQPLMVFAIGILLTLLFPRLGTESIRLRHVFQKLLAIAVVGLGTWLLFL